MKSKATFIIFIVISTLAALAIGFYFGQNPDSLKLSLGQSDQLLNPFINQEKQKELPLLKYTIPNLKKSFHKRLHS